MAEARQQHEAGQVGGERDGRDDRHDRRVGYGAEDGFACNFHQHRNPEQTLNHAFDDGRAGAPLQ